MARDTQSLIADAAHPAGRSHGRVALKMVVVAVAMFGFGYLMVPLYNIICDITGLNGKTGRVSESVASQEQAIDREIVVEFTSNIAAGGSWTFKPLQHEMTVRPGETYKASYIAENLRNVPMVAQATPSVTPSAAAAYFNKTECFCFTRQEFAPGEVKEMPLVFIIDPKVPVNVDRVTLSYTFFNSPEQDS